VWTNQASVPHLQLPLDKRRIGGANLEYIHDARYRPCPHTLVLVRQKVRVRQVLRERGKGARVDLVQIITAQLGGELLESRQQVANRNCFAGAPRERLIKL
jgi:hypothetical protein